MKFVNTKSKIIHYPSCRFVSRIADENLGGYGSVFDARQDGYRQCKCCDPMAKLLYEREKQVTELCRRRAISCEVDNGELIITTPFSEWKAYVGDNNRLLLYHRNTQGNIYDYHLQADRYTSIIKMLKFIDNHDKYRLEHPLPKQKKKKSAPRKGTKRYRSAQRRNKEKQRRREIRNVLNLIDSLSFS